MQGIVRIVHPVPGFPRFRDFRARTAYAGKKDRSPSRCYYTMRPGVNQTRKRRRTREKKLPGPFFPRWSDLLVKFYGSRRIRAKRKPHPERYPDAAWFCFLFRPFRSDGIRSFRQKESRNRDLLALVHIHVLREEQIGDEAHADEREAGKRKEEPVRLVGGARRRGLFFEARRARIQGTAKK